MNVLIIEDEKPNFIHLRKLLGSLRPKARIIGPVDNVADAGDILSESDFDLILADIQLSDGLVFEAFDGVAVKKPIIFTTAYDEYAIKAFKYNGIDYLLKPIDKDDLSNALDRFDQNRDHESSQQLDALYDMLRKDCARFRQRFLVPDRDGMVSVSTDEIRFISTDTGIVRLYLARKRTYAVDISLDEIENQLDPDKFLRVTRQHILRIDAVERLTTWFSRKTKVQIADWPDAEIYVSKERSSVLRQWLDR